MPLSVQDSTFRHFPASVQNGN